MGAYFGQQFGFSHSNTYGNGYLETRAYQQGAKSCLIELPMPSSSSSITSNDYAGKLTNGLVNMITKRLEKAREYALAKPDPQRKRLRRERE